MIDDICSKCQIHGEDFVDVHKLYRNFFDSTEIVIYRTRGKNADPLYVDAMN